MSLDLIELEQNVKDIYGEIIDNIGTITTDVKAIIAFYETVMPLLEDAIEKLEELGGTVSETTKELISEIKEKLEEHGVMSDETLAEKVAQIDAIDDEVQNDGNEA